MRVPAHVRCYFWCPLLCLGITVMADQDSLTYTGLCYGGDGQSWCLSDSQGPAKRDQVSRSATLDAFPLPLGTGLACVEVESPAKPGVKLWGKGNLDSWVRSSKLLTEHSHRALKTRGNTPKYGLIFHSTFIGRAAAKNKGRISRYLANKCSIASRIDCFSGMDEEVGI